ncbi:universal stress protein [Vibrio viridaestus]|uniref:Universal stress protein n=1 Tax=Vibrio viridaestus TaxID=2487322 RepID=A0A3N9TZ22_9VIBR|nr:universal stress protein [Vibrio viridaestus]RQW62202.1 universal stress global response regulator UspA [Vibrio viridaestus]
MIYQHILVALELSEDSKKLIDKAISFAQAAQADISFIHVDGTIGDISTELIDIQADKTARPLNDRANEMLRELQAYPDCPIQKFLVGTGDLGDKLAGTIIENDFDLLVCGHHHDFWSNIVSYSRHLINKSSIDILVVPLRK